MQEWLHIKSASKVRNIPIRYSNTCSKEKEKIFKCQKIWKLLKSRKEIFCIVTVMFYTQIQFINAKTESAMHKEIPGRGRLTTLAQYWKLVYRKKTSENCETLVSLMVMAGTWGWLFLPPLERSGSRWCSVRRRRCHPLYRTLLWISMAVRKRELYL